MKRFFEEFIGFMVLKKKTITIGQANLFVTVVIFLFTILFAYLLIIENYHDYERALLSEQQNYTLGQKLDSEIQHLKNEQKLKTLLIKNTIAIATLALIEHFLNFFAEAAHGGKEIDSKRIFFKEFISMVDCANIMVRTISEQKAELKELNSNLEDKVKQKTEKLLLTNQSLLEEQKHKDKILKAQKEFLRHTVHETNTPLSVILTSIELYHLGHNAQRQLQKIEVAVKNIFSIYDDLSYLVKKDQVEYPKAAIDLIEFINSRIDFFSEVAEMSRLKFEFSSTCKHVFIYINKTKLQRIVDNTLTNAIKYTLADQKIIVHVKQELSSAVFSVGSRSKEIENMEKIFEAYYREQRGVDGFGLGLGLVQNICKEEDVEIDVHEKDGMNIFSYRFKIMGE